MTIGKCTILLCITMFVNVAQIEQSFIVRNDERHSLCVTDCMTNKGSTLFWAWFISLLKRSTDTTRKQTDLNPIPY